MASRRVLVHEDVEIGPLISPQSNNSRHASYVPEYVDHLLEKCSRKSQRALSTMEVSEEDKAQFVLNKTLLENVSKDDNHVLVQELISRGASVNAVRTDKNAAIHIAVDNDCSAILGLLISSGCDLSVQNKAGQTCLHLARSAGVAERLIAAGCGINERDSRGRTPLHLATDPDVASILIQNGSNVNTEDEQRRTSLHHANNPDVLNVLIDYGGIVSARDRAGRTPLHFATCQESAAILVQNGADIGCKDNEGRLPLHVASLRGHGGVVKYLLYRGCKADARDGSMCTALHMASNDSIVRLLIRAGACVNARNDQGATSLLSSVRMKNTSSSIFFLDYGMPPVESCCNDGNTALHEAVKMNDPEMVKLLMTYKDLSLVQNNAGNTPVHLAAMHGRTDILLEILSSATNTEALSVVNDIGRTPLHLAIMEGHTDLLNLLEAKELPVEQSSRLNDLYLQEIEELQNFVSTHLICDNPGHLSTILKDKNDKIFRIRQSIKCHSYNVKDHEGNTPLHLAVMRGKVEMVSELHKRGISDIPNDDGDNALHIAVTSKHLNVLQALLEHFKDDYLYNARNKQGCTPLHFAARTGQVDMLKEMLGQERVLVNAKNWDGSTPLHEAVVNKQEEAAQLLLQSWGDMKCIVDGLSTEEAIKLYIPHMWRKLPLVSVESVTFSKQSLFRALYCERSDMFVGLLNCGTTDLSKCDGRYTPLQVACLLGLEECVDALLRQNMKLITLPCSEDHGFVGSPFLFAASWGYFKILLKYKSELGYFTTISKENVLHLLTKGLNNSLKDQWSFFSQVNLNTKEQDYDYCILELLTYFELNENFSSVINAEDEEKNTPLYYCITSRRKDTTVAMLLHGADPWRQDKSGKPLISYIPESTLEKYLDKCITLRCKSDDNTLDAIIDYRLMRLNRKVSEFEPLEYFSYSTKHTQLLKHPVISTLLFFKCKHIAPFFWMNFFLYAIFVLLWTFHAVFNSPHLNINDFSYEPISWYLSIAFWVTLCFRESCQFVRDPLRYFSYFENVMETIILLLCGITFFGSYIPVSVRRQIMVIATLISWLELVFLLGRIPHPFANYVQMFVAVLQNYAKAFLVFLWMICGFALSFYLTFQHCDNSKCNSFFKSVNGTAVQIAVLMLGEIDLKDFPFGFQPVISQIVLLLFIILIVLVLMNLLNALAVSETQAIVDQAELYCMRSFIEVICQVESTFCPRTFTKKKSCGLNFRFPSLPHRCTCLAINWHLFWNRLKRKILPRCMTRSEYMKNKILLLPKLKSGKVAVDLSNGDVRNTSWRLTMDHVESIRACLYRNTSELQKEVTRK